MTTQRDRLAEVLDELAGRLFDVDWYADGDRLKPVLANADDLADALLARGVRVVDVETLAAALRVFIWDQFDGDVDEGDRRQAEEFLAVLDRREADR